MDHEVSVKTRAAERYLLGELPPDEGEAFEEHFMECGECAEQVRTAFEFADNARAAFGEAPPQAQAAKRKRDLFSWLRLPVMLPAAACLGLAALAVYQSTMVIPGLRNGAPAVIASAVLVPAARGELRSITVPRGARFFVVSLETGLSGAYRCELRSGDGKSMWSTEARGANPNLLIPAGLVNTGEYEIELRAEAGSRGLGAGGVEVFRFRVGRE